MGRLDAHTEILHRRPLIGEFYWHDNYSDAAG
jgi:hypothetical protein